MSDDFSESNLSSITGIQAHRQQTHQPDNKLGGSKLDSCFLEVLYVTAYWPANLLQTLLPHSFLGYRQMH